MSRSTTSPARKSRVRRKNPSATPQPVLAPIFVRDAMLYATVGVPVSSANRLTRQGLFPAKVALTDGTTARRYDELLAWAATRPPASGRTRGEGS